MSDQNKQELADTLRKEVKKASSNVSHKVEAEKNEYKVIISSNEITQHYKNKQVGSIRVAELSDKLIAMINEDPGDAAQEMLTEFRKSFNTEDVEKTAEKETKVEKTAAHETQDAGTHQMITQKQFDEQKPDLHPRTEEHYTNVTQKQLPEHGQRPGTYDETTEGQFKNERDTFYGVTRTSGDWKSEDRNVVTERQFEEGVSDYSDVATSDRGEMGAKYDGEIAAQHKQIGEKQLAELLKHHEWTEPLTITEGKDQLGQQEGELSRLTAEIADKIIKEAAEALGNTVIAAGVTPDKLMGLVKRLVSHASKYPALANTIGLYSNLPVTAINEKVANARYFGKTANTNKDYSPFLIADVFVRQLAKMAYSPNFIVEGLRAMSEDKNFASKINESVETIMANKRTEVKESSNVDVFKQVLADCSEKSEDCKVEGKADDGLYSYIGSIKEVNADPNEKEAFSEAATTYAKTKIAAQLDKNINLQPVQIDVKADQFEMVFKDADFENSELETRAYKRREMAKEASSKDASKTAQMGGAGGMPPAAGPEMAGPGAPPGGADMAAPPPGEALSQEPLPEEEGLGEEGTGEPKPPGSICPVCGSNDVDVDNGEFRCQNCGGEGVIHVNLDVTKWPETIQESEETNNSGFGLGEDEEGFGAEEAGMEGGLDEMGGAGTTMPNVPVGASVRLTPFLMERLSSQKINLGTVCPSCGGHNTDLAKFANTKGLNGICYDCYQEYNFKLKSNRKDKKVFAQHTWLKKTAEASCNGCSRNPLKQAFISSLDNYGMSWNQFDNLGSMKEKGDVILKMAKSNTLNIKEAMNTKLPITKYAASAKWKGYQKFDKFPSASCRERLARRFGENATAMSGPCQGDVLSDCVCKQLESLGIYSDGLSAKVASIQNSKDPMINNPVKECVAMFVKNDYDVSDACTACDGLRSAYADLEELIVEAVAQIDPKMMPIGNATGGMLGGDKSKGEAQAMPMPKPLDDPITDGLDDGIDDEGMNDEGMDDMGDFGGEGEVTIKMPAELASSIAEIGVLVDQALNGGLGDDMFEDDSMGDDLDMGEVTEDTVGGDDADDADDVVNEDFESEDIPGLADDNDDSESPDMIKESEPETFDIESKDMEAPNNEVTSEPRVQVTSEPRAQVSAESKKKPKEAEVSKEATAKELDSLLYSMKSGTIKSSKESLDNVLDGLLRQATLAAETKIAAKTGGDIKKMDRKPATEGDKIKATPAQDSGGFGAVKDGGKIGHENSFTDGVESKPDVPRKAATMGDEGSEATVSESSDLPTVPHGSPAMAGEEHYRPEKGNMVDGNQSAQTTASTKATVKTAGCKKCDSDTCGCGSAYCEQHCFKCKNKEASTKTSGCECTSDSNCEGKCVSDCKCKSCSDSKQCGSVAENNMKQYKVATTHKYYSAFKTKLTHGSRGTKGTIKLEDGNTYDMSIDKDNNIILASKTLRTCKECGKALKFEGASATCPSCEKSAKSSGEIKESQTVSPKVVKDLQDDPDINPSSGPGAGKTHGDTVHSLAVDEKKPSDGMSEPDVPAAPDDGRLKREHTVEKAKDGPEIPADGGMNPEYDNNEKNTPEKLDETLGKENDIAAMASRKNEAIKIAGQLLKLNHISTDELPSKVEELSNATPEILADYKKLLNQQATTTKGMQKQQAAGTVETPILQKTAATEETENSLQQNIQSMFKLDERNRDHERHSDNRGSLGLFR